MHECEDDEDGATRTLNNNKDDESSVGEPAVKKKATAVTSGFFKVSKALLDNSIVDVDISLLSKDNRIVGTLKSSVSSSSFPVLLFFYLSLSLSLSRSTLTSLSFRNRIMLILASTIRLY